MLKDMVLSFIKNFFRSTSQTSKPTKSVKKWRFGLQPLLKRFQKIDEELFDEIETLLITSDMGLDLSEHIIDQLKSQLKRGQSSEFVIKQLSLLLQQILNENHQALNLGDHSPHVIMIIGVNGVGKTTTLGKLAQYFKQLNVPLILAAGDTFRAAASEQLISWAQQLDVPIVAQQKQADSASVIFDAIQAAKHRNFDLVLADTAGRLHNKVNLMNELTKINRTVAKARVTQHTLLVIDASMGQNALIQAKTFAEHIKIDGIILTKLDGSAKGGIVFAIQAALKVPIYFIGTGEQAIDLHAFNPKLFVDEFLAQ